MEKFNVLKTTRYIKAVIALDFKVYETEATSRYIIHDNDVEGLRYKNLESGKNYTKSPTPNNWRIKNV